MIFLFQQPKWTQTTVITGERSQPRLREVEMGRIFGEEQTVQLIKFIQCIQGMIGKNVFGSHYKALKHQSPECH